MVYLPSLKTHRMSFVGGVTFALVVMLLVKVLSTVYGAMLLTAVAAAGIAVFSHGGELMFSWEYWRSADIPWMSTMASLMKEGSGDVIEHAAAATGAASKTSGPRKLLKSSNEKPKEESKAELKKAKKKMRNSEQLPARPIPTPELEESENETSGEEEVHSSPRKKKAPHRERERELERERERERELEWEREIERERQREQERRREREREREIRMIRERELEREEWGGGS